MTTPGQPAEASRPLEEVVPAGSVVVVDEGAMSIPPASQLKKKLTPVCTLKHKGMTPASTDYSLLPRKPNIGNFCIRTKSPEAWTVDVEGVPELTMTVTAKHHHPLYPKTVPNVPKPQRPMTNTSSRPTMTPQRQPTERINP